jgi:cell division protein FtsL
MHARIEKIAARELGMRAPAASRTQIVGSSAQAAR